MNKNTYFLYGIIFCCITNHLFSQQIRFQDYQPPDFSNRTAPLNKLDLSQNVLDESKYPQIHIYRNACTFSQTGQVLTLSNEKESTETQESFISIGTLCADAIIDLDVLSQTHNAFAAQGLLSLYRDKDNRMLFAQRDIDAPKKMTTFEIFKDGVSVFNEALLLTGVSPPNTLRVHLTGTTLNFLLVKEGQCSVLGSIKVGPYFDLSDETIRNSFSVCVGAKLRGGETISLTRFEQYRIGSTTEAVSKAVHSEQAKNVKPPLNTVVLISAVLAVLGLTGIAVFLFGSRVSKMRRKQTEPSENAPANREF